MVSIRFVETSNEAIGVCFGRQVNSNSADLPLSGSGRFLDQKQLCLRLRKVYFPDRSRIL